MAQTGIFRFEDVEVRPEERVVLKAGIPVALEPKAFRLLIYLLRNPGRLVTKEELLDAVWEEASVSENSLTRSMAALRRQLGDDAREPRFIATVHTAGYRWICPFERPEISRGASPAPHAEASTFPGNKRHFGLLGALVALVLLLVWFGTQYSKDRPSTARMGSVPFKVIPVTNLSGAVGDPALSPDGKQIAFFWEPDGRELGDWAGLSLQRAALYVQLVSGGEPLQLTQPKAGYVGHPVWSPDGQEISFGRCNDEGGAIYTISALGGPEHKITDVVCPFGDPGEARWTHDGSDMILLDRCGQGKTRGINLFSLSAGKKHCITAPANGSDFSPMPSPDGQTIAFIRMN